MNRTDKIMITAWGLWGTLGCYRGHQYYKKELKRYTNMKKYYYVTNFGYGLAGTTFYVCPVFMGLTCIYELYNLEEAIRGIESDD